MNFEEIKDLYEQSRECERVSIVKRLLEAGFTASLKGGKGIANYTSGGTIAPYDLRNFKYIEAAKNGVKHLISLQSFDVDPNSQNRHILMDRLGVYTYTGKYNPSDAQTKMRSTNVDLPMNNDKMKALIAMLEVCDGE